uniref:Protein wntless n=1 Tax=Lygus hesperus TaxID=30085 RepID=A0A146L601_LYGHE
MTGTVLENLSGRKLAVLVSFFLICQIVCFLIGGIIAPKPSITDSVLATKCIDTSNHSEEWFYSRGPKPCRGIDLGNFMYEEQAFANQIVFVFQIPSPREKVLLDYSRWQQNLVGILHLDVLYHSQNEMAPRTVLTIDAKLGYQDKHDPPAKWTYYASSVERRNLDCTMEQAINQTGGFTKVWLSLKCVFFPSIVGILVWFLRRISGLQRKPQVLETMLIIVALSLTLLNAPVELLTLFFDLPFMLLLTDIRQGIFYAALLSFWLVFSAEHLMVQEVQKKSLKDYWPYFSSVVVGCVSLFVFELCERGIQLKNPFYSIWVTDAGTKLAMALLVIGGLCGIGYLILLCYLIWKVFCNIGTKRASLPAMSQARKLHYSGIIYRFNFLMIATVVCAALTMVTFCLGQVSEGQFKWEDHDGLEYTSAFFTGVYGMWNIYIFSLLVLYAPSHKHWPSQADLSIPTNEIEFSCLEPEPSEISSLTTFTKKTALD